MGEFDNSVKKGIDKVIQKVKELGQSEPAINRDEERLKRQRDYARRIAEKKNQTTRRSL